MPSNLKMQGTTFEQANDRGTGLWGNKEWEHALGENSTSFEFLSIII